MHAAVTVQDRTCWLLRVLVVFALWSAAIGCAAASETELRVLLAPGGKLRAGLYPGTPTSILDAESAQPRGVGYEVGAALARKLGVPYEPVVFGKNAEVLEAVKTGATDAAFTNATAARAKDMDFGPPYLEIELGYLVRKDSGLTAISQIDNPKVRVGVTQGSTSDSVLSRELKQAELIRIVTLKQGIEMLRQGSIDAYATNKATLFEMADYVPGSAVLDGRWGVERHAIAIPKGREAALPFLRSFTEEIKAQGLVKAAVARAGLRGAVVPD